MTPINVKVEEVDKELRPEQKAILALTRGNSSWPMMVSDEDADLISKLVYEAESGIARPTPNTDQVVEALTEALDFLHDRGLISGISDVEKFRRWKKALATTQPSEKERRHKPCGAEYCCYTDDRELVECLEANLKKEEAENKVLREDLKTAINLAAAPDDEWDGKHDALLSDCAKHLKPRGE